MQIHWIRPANNIRTFKNEYRRAKSGYSNQSESNAYRHDLMLKNLYRQQLDDIMKQKNEQKRIEKEK